MLGGVSGKDGVSDERGSGVGIERRANEQDGVKAESGEIDFRLRVGVDAEVANVGNDANDGDLRGNGTHHADKDVGSDGISRGEVVVRECFVDDEETGGAIDIALRKGSAFEQADAHGAEVVGADEADLRVGEGAGCQSGSAFDEKARHDLRWVERDLGGCGCGEDSA